MDVPHITHYQHACYCHSDDVGPPTVISVICVHASMVLHLHTAQLLQTLKEKKVSLCESHLPEGICLVMLLGLHSAYHQH